MRRLAAALLCAILFLTGCTVEAPQPAEEPSQPQAEALAPAPEEEPEEDDTPAENSVFVPDSALELEETVAAYFEQTYRAYASLSYIDISALLDTGEQGNRNLLAWLELLSMRRRLIWEHGFCYVEREQFAYEITYIDAADLDDERMVHWDNGWIGPEETVLHFVISGEAGRAYPPTFAVNSQHTMRLHQVDGEWRILFHYFPGSARKFYLNDGLRVPAEEEMLAALHDEFAPLDDPEPPELPAGAAAYDPGRAAEYALRYAEQPNPDFYYIGDWIGNCANFTSQCLWYGFGGEDAYAYERMTAEWYSGDGGGALAWENVESFWAYITSGYALHGQVLDGAEQLRTGDLVQLRVGVALPQEGASGGRRFNHTLIVADAETLLLAQNSPASLTYYADLVAVETRFVRPVWLL